MWNVSCMFEKGVWECCVGFTHTEEFLRPAYTLRTLPLSQPWHPAGVCQAKTASKAETIDEEDKRDKGCVWREEVKCVMEKLQGGCVSFWMSWWTEWAHSYTYIPEKYRKVSRRHSMDIWNTESTTGKCCVGVGINHFHQNRTDRMILHFAVCSQTLKYKDVSTHWQNIFILYII